jgi:phosphate transport system substrate-binding protein
MTATIKEKSMKTTRKWALLAAACVGLGAAEQAVSVDAGLTSYKAVSGVSGNARSVGSDTLNNLMTLWAEQFKKFYPNVNIEIEGKGSTTAPPALISGTAQFGPMSRAMKNTEIDAFESKFGYKPTEIRTSVDALAVFVNKDNPIKSLTLRQVDGIFSKSRRRGGKEIRTWGDLGLTGDWAGRPISLYGRNSASGTYGFFKEHALKNGDLRDEVKEQPGSASVILAVTQDRYAIGYSGVGYSTSGVRAVPLAEKEGGSPVPATAPNAYSGDYPLSRYLFVYINKHPNQPLDPLRREFMKLILSREGQEVVVKDGFFPIPASIAAQELKKVE